MRNAVRSELTNAQRIKRGLPPKAPKRMWTSTLSKLLPSLSRPSQREEVERVLIWSAANRRLVS